MYIGGMGNGDQQQNPSWRSAVIRGCLSSLQALLLLPVLVLAQASMTYTPLNAINVYQGAKGSDAFSAIHYLGNGHINTLSLVRII